MGNCHLCGEKKELTREHIPPRKAFNDFPVLLQKIDREAKTAEVSWTPAGPVEQGGHSVYTLCAQCNSDTGSWYGPAYVEFVHACAPRAEPRYANQIVEVCAIAYPLRVAKQALVIMCSSCGSNLVQTHPEIRALLLDKKQRGLPRPLRLYAYIRCLEGGRTSGVSSILNVDPDTLHVSSPAKKVAEFSWWPLGLVLSFSALPLDQVADITRWLDYDYNYHTTGPLTLPCRCTVTPYPLDYRTPEEVARQIAESRAGNAG